MSKKQIDKMVDRFLCWELPKDFCPDGRISFDPAPDAMGNDPTWPVGTNLLTAVQARDMLDHIVAGENTDGLLEAVKFAYRKHHLNDDSIGWEELSEILLDALCNAMGDDEYQTWVNSWKTVRQTA